MVEGLSDAAGVRPASCVDLRRWPIRSASELRPLGEVAADLSDGWLSLDRIVPEALGVCDNGADELFVPCPCVDPIREPYCRIRELSFVVPAEDRVELLFGVEVMRPEGPGPVEVLVDGWLDRDWMSRRRLAMRSAID